MSDDKMQLEEVNQPEPTADKTSEVVEAPDEWQTLDGKSQDRFQALANLKKEAERQAEKERSERQRLERELEEARTVQQRVPMPRTGEMSPDEEAAYKRLTQLGVADQAYVKREIDSQVKRIEDRLYFDALHSKLESEFNSKKGMPRYDRAEIEAHMKEHQNFDPRAAYRDLYYDELVAFEVENSKKQKVVQTEPTKSRIGSSEPWTKASLAERLRQPDGVEFFRKNRDKIMRMQSTLE